MAGMTQLVDALAAFGIRFSVVDGELVCHASRKAATDEIRDVVARYRSAIHWHLEPDTLVLGAPPASDGIGPSASPTHVPPKGCIAPKIACSILGSCDRHLAGEPCLAVCPIAHREAA